MPKIGAHVSAAGGVFNSVDKALEIGATCTQIFISPPQTWLQKKFTEEEIKKYKTKIKESGIGPNFNHGIYLINLATDNQVNLKRNIGWLKYSLETAEVLGLAGTIFHLGSSKDREESEALEQVVESVKEILKDSPSKPWLILETAAGAGNVIGDSIIELGQILKKVKDPRVKVCLDTQHIFASGIDIRKKEVAEQLISDLDKEIGINNLAAIHVNDSKTELGSKKDRHENIGEGLIGKEAFKILLNHPKLQKIAFILEVPGFKGTGPDKENIQILKSLIS